MIDPFSLTLIVGMLGLLIVAVIWLAVLVIRINMQLQDMQNIFTAQRNASKQSAMSTPSSGPKERFHFHDAGVKQDADYYGPRNEPLPVYDPRNHKDR